MAIKRKTVKTSNKSSSKTLDRKLSKDLDTSDVSDISENLDYESSISNKAPRRRFFLKYIALAVLIVLVVGLLVRNRGWFIAATVNGSPIWRLDLNNRLTERFGSQLLEAMIGEKIIAEAAVKSGITTTPEEINSRIGDIEKSLSGSMKLEDALKLQGVSKSEFESQVRIQLLIDKMLSKEVSVSAQEVDEFVKGASSNLTASDPAQRRAEAEKEILNTKVSEKFQEWFTKVKNDAKISRFL